MGGRERHNPGPAQKVSKREERSQCPGTEPPAGTCLRCALICDHGSSSCPDWSALQSRKFSRAVILRSSRSVRRSCRCHRSPALPERGLPGGVQPVRFGTMPAVASMVELVEMEGDALALAGNWVLVRE